MVLFYHILTKSNRGLFFSAGQPHRCLCTGWHILPERHPAAMRGGDLLHHMKSQNVRGLLVLRHAGGWGWGIFAFVWLSAIAGFILSFKKLKEHSNLETACYVGMGACILVAMKPLLDHLGELEATTAFWWLIGGGVSYIVGAVFYSLRKPYMHATFHLFCLGGSIGHIIAIWLIL